MELQEREVDMCFVGQIPNPTPGDLGHPISQNPPLFDCFSKNPTPKPEIAIKGN